MLKRSMIIVGIAAAGLSLAACDTYTVHDYNDPGPASISSNAGSRDQICAKLARQLGYNGHNNYDETYKNNPSMYKKVQSFKAHGCDK